MSLTAGGAITAALRYLVNVGSDAYLYDVQERARAEFLLRKRGAYLWTMAPHWFRMGDGTVTADAGNGYGTMPANFSSFGDQGQAYIQNQQTPLEYLEPDILLGLIETTGTHGVPTHYTLHTRSAEGRPLIYLYPVNTVQTVISLRGYKLRVPDFIDYPLTAPTAAAGVTGVLTGDYNYRVTFVTDAAETEGGTVSNTVTVAAKKIGLTGVPIAINQAVTSRNVYRTEAGGEQHMLVDSIDDNVTTTFLDNTADVDLGADIPTGLNAVTGMENFPEDFHEMLVVEALAADLNPERPFDWQGWEKRARRLWSEQKQGQNVLQVMPAYGQAGSGGYRSRLRNVI